MLFRHLFCTRYCAIFAISNVNAKTQTLQKERYDENETTDSLRFGARFNCEL